VPEVANRTEIKAHLDQALADFESAVRALSPDDLVLPCTESEDAGSGAWSPMDHVAHVIRIERSFLGMARRAADGDPDPIKFSALGSNREEVAAAIHRQNQQHVESLRSRTLDELFDELAAARRDTLEFLDALDDQTLMKPIPGSPWGDGTIGGILGRNGDHELNHLKHLQEGLAQART
jgi:uncharacterized damage-inducible protein DinB